MCAACVAFIPGECEPLEFHSAVDGNKQLAHVTGYVSTGKGLPNGREHSFQPLRRSVATLTRVARFQVITRRLQLQLQLAAQLVSILRQLCREHCREPVRKWHYVLRSRVQSGCLGRDSTTP